MIITLTTEYETIYFYSEKPLDTSKIDNIKSNFNKEMKKWKTDREVYLKNNNIDEEELKYSLENLRHTKEKLNNPFFDKKLKELSKKEQVINEYHFLNPRPDFLIISKLEKMGLNVLSKENANINISIKENSKLDVNLNINYKKNA